MRHVTCVMPTTGARRWCLPWAIDYFLQQTYIDTDLLVVVDGDDDMVDVVPSHRRVTRIHLGERQPLGTKYNACAAMAKGPYVALWADDDWHAPWRLTYAMESMTAGKEIVGLRQMIFHRIGTRSTWIYRFPDLEQSYFIGGSLVFHKDYWKRHRFESGAKSRADASFTNDISWEEYQRVAAVLDDPEFYVAINHGDNTGRKSDPAPDARWSRFTGNLVDIMGGDWERYAPPVAAA